MVKRARIAAPRRAGRPWIAAGAAALLVAAATAFVKLGAPAIRREAGLSVLLISIDTLRADALGAYGRRDGQTPWIDRLARAGVVFEDAHAHNVMTLPSHANILSGQYPTRHGVRDNSGFRFPKDLPTLATLLRAGGYRTGAFVSAFPLDSRFGLDRGFDVYDDQLGGAETHTAFLVPERGGAATVRAAATWLQAQGGSKAFSFVHLYEPHFPYQPPEPFATRYRDDPYHGEVAAADAALAPLLRPILEAGERGRTLVVFTADHGEALGDHGEMTHGLFAYEATLRVPLVLFAPRILQPGVVREPVWHVDILPTVLDALALEPPAGLAGRSLLPLIAGRRERASSVYFEALSSSLNRGWAPLHGVIQDRIKYVDLPLPELYDLENDPAEANNLLASRPEDVARLRALLGGLRAGERAGARVAEEAAARERLRALGYTSGGAAPKQRYDAADDPKRLVQLDADLGEVLLLLTRRDYERAIAICRRNLEQRPDMPLVHTHLAYLERARGNLPAAVAAARRAVELRPADPELVSSLATYLTESGRAREALELLEPLAGSAQPDLDVLMARGMALATLGHREDALATFARAREVDPTNAMALVNIGTVHLLADDRSRAREAFEAALQIDPAVARAHNSLGVIAFREGRGDEAVERWKRAVALDPTDYQTLFNLGSVLRRQGRNDEARPFLEAYLAAAPVALEKADIARVRAWLRSGP
jgi:arylsulfatase A-like enzyme/Flp pilus assembly protein TadD